MGFSLGYEACLGWHSGGTEVAWGLHEVARVCMGVAQGRTEVAWGLHGPSSRMQFAEHSDSRLLLICQALALPADSIKFSSFRQSNASSVGHCCVICLQACAYLRSIAPCTFFRPSWTAFKYWLASLRLSSGTSASICSIDSISCPYRS